jgi:DNA-binding LytR/AlgR family response regulator
MMNCIIIEDQPPAQRILKKYICDVPHLDLKACFSSALEAIAFLKSEKVALIFLDIHLPKISGIDFLKSIAPDSHVILTTAFSEYALESYEYNVVDYLLKPFSFERFLKAVSKIPQPKSMPLHSKTNVPTSTPTEDALFTVQKKRLASNPLHYWAKKLNNKGFCQIHKSYIVNLKQVVRISGNMASLSNGAIIPVGRTFKEVFSKYFLS